MKNYLNIFILIAIFFVFQLSIHAQKFSNIQKQKLNEKAALIAKDYAKLMKTIAQKKLSVNEKQVAIDNFFKKTNILLYNNIAPDIQNEFISVKEYLQILKNDYPAGLIIKVDYTGDKLEPGLLTESGAKLYVAIPNAGFCYRNL